jgi:hypothetical protein
MFTEEEYPEDVLAAAMWFAEGCKAIMPGERVIAFRPRTAPGARTRENR